MPRTPSEAGLLEVKLKRKIEYKNVHQQAYIDPEKIYNALNFLKESGHPHYQFFDDLKLYKERCKIDDTGSKLVFVESSSKSEVLGLVGDVVIVKELAQNDHSQMWEISNEGVSSNEGYFTLKNHMSQKFLTGVSAENFVVKGVCLNYNHTENNYYNLSSFSK